MSGVLTPGLRVDAEATIVRRRELPVAGRILVGRGDKVSADTVVAEALVQGEVTIVRVAERMGLIAADVMPLMKAAGVTVGGAISEGQTIAEHRGLFGLFRTLCVAPCSGTVEFISERTGHIGIRRAANPLSMRAYLAGEVVEVIPERAVSIAAQCAFIQGIFGIGGERFGTLRALGLGPTDKIEDRLIPEDCRNSILWGGRNPSAAVLSMAAERGAVGFIVASIDDKALAGYLGYDIGVAITGDEAVSMSIIVTEGFGALAMAERTVALLKKFEGFEASLNGATQVRAGAVRPEIIIPHREAHPTSKPSDSNRTLAPGSSVRIIRVPYFGEVAEVVELPAELTTLETGARARVLKARLRSGAVVTVPRANIELLEFGAVGAKLQ